MCFAGVMGKISNSLRFLEDSLLWACELTEPRQFCFFLPIYVKIWFSSSKVDAQLQVVRKLEEKEHLLQSNIGTGEKELGLRTQALEMNKRKVWLIAL